MVGIFKGAGLVLLALCSTLVSSESPELLEDEPQLLYNASFVLAEVDSSLNARAWSPFHLFHRAYYTCPAGYRSCSTGYCAEIGGKCCTIGTCPSGYNCCGSSGRCSPIGAECCGNGYYCLAGNRCRTRNGRQVCCPASGCLSDSSGSLGKTVTAADTTTITGAAAITRTRYSYYYTTYYWTYWWYFWTSYSPYTEKTVTSTRTSTRTVWSAYETARADARSSFSRSIKSYTFSTPYSATYLKSSTSAVPLNTGVIASSTSSSSSSNTDSVSNMVGDANGFPSKPDVASGVFVNEMLVWTCALMAMAMGGLAIGL
ncbi:hypothetical protein N7492_005564 [Penicillium capsulatum]|uniref:GPI anchored protein n=1 Tax=Penicillium capsulatum TaxID=69766 RepID=A0A9W9IA21_9EURO|nr:hypothetical protein N7492_005564 [Penicillium capsulatum]KAJ6135336.1 hypothetical protein N7512_000496 [Penicillium capsulatum]